METKTEIKTIHDLPEEIKKMYRIYDGNDNINEPAFVGLNSMGYNITESDVCYSIRVDNKAHITIYKNFQMMHITIF